jgi:NAD(P)-dependent dehydrogenase (short-subunit alcohol dehydrogenase family)
MDVRFDGLTALVTGGANGIGLAMARALRDSGARVWIADLPRENVLDVAARESVQGVECDVTDEDSLDRAFQAAGEPGIVFVNAGIGVGAWLDQTTRDLWDRTLAVNLTGAFLTVQRAARAMKSRRKGAIVVTASTNSFDGEEQLTAYNATKAGLLGIIHTAANELGPHGIRINAVCPGYIRTRLTAEGFADSAFAKRYFGNLPLGRGGEPHEVAAAALFLASEHASFITGATLFVDGGQMAAKFGTWREESARFVNDHWELK